MTSRIENSRTPDLIELIRVAIDNAISEMFVGMPGIVVKYNASQQKADIQPLLNRSYVNEDGSEGEDVLPVLPDVPIQFGRGGGYFASFPLQAGDKVVLFFMDRSIDNFLSGSGTAPLDPVDFRQHDISDAVAFPCGHTFSGAIKDNLSGGAVLGKEGGAQVRIKGDNVEITSKGAPASVAGYVAMSALVDSLWAVLTATLDAFVPPGTPDGGAALATALSTAIKAVPSYQATGSTNLKAD